MSADIYKTLASIATERASLDENLLISSKVIETILVMMITTQLKINSTSHKDLRGVSTQSGQTALHVTPNCAFSRAHPCDKQTHIKNNENLWRIVVDSSRFMNRSQWRKTFATWSLRQPISSDYRRLLYDICNQPRMKISHHANVFSWK